MSTENRNGFHFGLEAEFLLVDSASFRPLWHTDLKFKCLNAALEAIPADNATASRWSRRIANQVLISSKAIIYPTRR